MWCLFPASCPRYAGKLSHPWESSTHYRNGMIPCISDRRCPNSCSLPPLEQNHGTSQNKAPAFAGQPAILNLSLVELPPRPLSAEIILFWMTWTHACIRLASFSSVYVLTCIGIFPCMPCSLAPNPKRAMKRSTSYA
jgi:hypothetical protein